MNHDENTPDVQTWIEPELEARIVAWISGEASAFESAELERLVGEKPELALFKQRMEAVRGLIAEAERPDSPLLRMAPERRAKLLETLAAADGPRAENVFKKSDVSEVYPLRAGTKSRRGHWRGRATLAAGLMLGLFFSTLIKYSSKNYESPGVGLEEDGVLRMKLPVARDREVRSDLEARESVEAAKQAALAERARLEAEPIYHARSPAVASRERQRRDSQAIDAPALNAGIVSKDVTGLQASRRGSFGRGLADAGSLQKIDTKNSILFGIGSPSDKATAYYKAQNASPSTYSETRIKANLSKNEADQVTGLGGATPPLSELVAKETVFDGHNQIPSLENKPKSAPFASAFSEPTKKSDDDDKVVLSPFSISAPAETTDLPRSSLAGSRLRSVLAPAPAETVQAEGRAQSTEELSDLKKSPSPVPTDGEAAVAQTLSDRPTTVLKSPAADPLAPSNQPFLEVSAARQPVSTFSLHVSDVSFRLAQAALASGELPDPERIRPEEFYNAFNYGDPAPAMAEKISCHIEQSAYPLLQQRNLVRIAMKVPAVGRGAAQVLRLTVMLDTSGSMEREDRAATVHRAMEVLVSLLGPNDRLTVVGFARQPRLLVDQLPGDKAKDALTVIAHTPSEGGTDLEAALKLAGELAVRNHEDAAQNRVVLLTDGAANLGNADPEQLAASIEALRQQGVAFDACGIGLDGLDDAMLERLTRKGDGRYYVLNTPEAADADFARQLAGAFRPAAKNVKVQVRFNPARVGAYRLIGFEQHRLNEEDFRNDQVDAAELAAEEAAVAVYQVETLPQGEGEVGEVYVRFRDASNGNMVERSWMLSYDPQVPAFDRATPSLQLAGVAVLLAEKLRGGSLADGIKLDELAPVVNAVRGHYQHEPRVQELVTMYEQVRRLKGE